MECRWQVEIDPFCNRVLAKHWPNVKRYADVKTVRNLEPVDLICGGFPCQPFSCAGKRGGKEDDRYLWPEMLRVISEVRPTWVIGENVAGIVNMALDQVCADLESKGYEVQAFIIPACAVNAPHRRDRVWIVAYSESKRSGREPKTVCGTECGQVDELFSNSLNTDSHASDTDRQGSQVGEVQPGHGREEQQTVVGGSWNEDWIEVATRLCRVDDGVPGRVDRLKSLGNAVVPQIVEIIGRMIMEVEE
jgi:DNA (cytosine-5)-methyltransferase 1